MNHAELEQLYKQCESTMTDAERTAAYAAGEEVDHIPYNILANEEAFASIFGYTTAQLRDDPKAHIDIIRRRQEEYGLTGLAAGLGLRAVGTAVGSKPIYPEVGIDRIGEHVIHSVNELGKIIDNDPFTNPFYLSILERGRILKDAFPDMGIGTSVTGPISAVANIIPIDTLLRESRKNPGPVHELLDFAVYHSISFVKMFVKEFGPTGYMVADPVACAGILSVKQFEDLAMPGLKKLMDGVTAELGTKPVLHICGKTKPLWKLFPELPIVGFSVDNCENLAEAKEGFGDKLALIGNVPPVDVMLLGSIDDVIESCKDCLRMGADSPNGYTLDVGCQVPIGTPADNMKAFIYAAKTFGSGARKGALPKGLVA